MKTNILIISSGYPSKDQPYSAFIALLAEEMARQGLAVSIIARQSITWHLLNHAPFEPRYSSKEINGNTIHIYRPYALTDEGRLSHIARIWNRWVVSRTAKRIPRPDVVYAHFWLNAVHIIDYIRSKNIPFIVATGEDNIPIHLITNQNKNWLQEHVQQVVCVSTKNKEESISLGLAKEEKCSVIPNAYNPKDFYHEDGTLMRKQLKINKDDFVVSFCGRWNERKGVFRLDEVLKRLNNPHIKAIYIGSPMDNCKDEPDYERIAFKGQLPHKEIVHYLNAADVFILPSLAEGCPNSVIEAMGCGLPIISSDLPFNYDILNIQNSILINPNNIDDIAKAIDKLYNNSYLRSKLANGALETAESLRIETRVKRIILLMVATCNIKY